MKWLLLALLAVPLVDALLLVVVADFLGWPATVLLVVLTALVGTLLVRAEGRNTLRRLSEKLRAGQPPTDELVDGGLLIAAGAFLLTPGLVTDLLGFLLVVPITRYPIRKLLKRRLRGTLDERSGGFVTGNVYTGGFPNGDAGGVDPSDAYQVSGSTGGDHYEVPDEDYSVEDDRD